MEKPIFLDYSLLLDSIYNGIIAINAEGIIAYFNKTAERIFKTPARDALGQYILDILPNTGGKILESLKTGKPFHGEKLKGKEVNLISNINPLMKNGAITGVVSVFHDISDIETISKELDMFKNMKSWLDTIINSSYDGLWICDHEGNALMLNKASERINGVEAANIIGKNMRELVRAGLFDKSVTLEVLQKKAPVTMIQRAHGDKKILVTGNPIFNDKGDIVFVVTNDRDITELDNLRSQLQEAQALAKGYISRLSNLQQEAADLANIIFRSAEMQRIIEMAMRVAQVDSTVLLLGESGVGKGIIATLIHKQSDRSKCPFIRVDLTGIPDSLIESELFGYEKGAFTGAKAEGKLGLFELANKGTLFLDEIGEIPFASQSTLLRFLEDHKITNVGGTESKEIDVRIIAATNRQIEEMVASKNFRADLYYRLNVVPIHIPSLKERTDDILPIAFHYLRKFNKAYKRKKILSPGAIDALCNYGFPGNIRELANLIERLVVSTDNDYVELRELPGYLTEKYPPPTVPASLLFEGLPLKEALEKCECEIIQRTIKQYGSQREAARILKIDQATVSRKSKKYSKLRPDALLHK
ncbi:MAG: sigma 54-interacting transcriptional regulator [Syntrophobacterales bacterium]|nr:sigma 54-interacting transcriptional regulator [Syntrophobacterales bacterium]